MVSSALVLLAALMKGQAWAAEPAANPFASREVTPGWTLTHFGQGEQRCLEKPLEAAFADGKFILQADSGMLFFKRSDEADGVGLMLRDENKPLGLYMCAMLETVHSKDLPENEHPIAASIRMRRQVSNEGFRVVRPDLVKLPVWLKVERQGKKFSSLYSPDGKSWKLLKEAEIEMEQKVSVGMTAWNRYGNGKFGVVVFEDVRVVTTEGNKH